MNFKDIEIGFLIQQRTEDCEIGMPRICNFFKLPEQEIEKMYKSKSLDSAILLKWSKLLEYDFFRLYTQHLILYAPPGIRKGPENIVLKKKVSRMPKFRKNIYTKEMIDFVLELIETGQKTRMQVIDEYHIPKTTLYKWFDKYKKN